MTVITVKDRLTREQRRTLAETLTDAVLVPGSRCISSNARRT